MEAGGRKDHQHQNRTNKENFENNASLAKSTATYGNLLIVGVCFASAAEIGEHSGFMRRG